MSEINLGEHGIVECEWLPHDKPPIVLADWPAPGQFTLLHNPNIPEGESADGPGHLERHGGRVVGPLTPVELVAALEGAVGIAEVRSPGAERWAQAQELKAKLDELLEGQDPAVVDLAATDCKALFPVWLRAAGEKPRPAGKGGA